VNRYQYARILGVFLLAAGVGALAVSYPSPLWLGAQAALLVVSGAFQILSGTPNALRERLGPHRLLGIGNVALGASLVTSGLQEFASDAEVAYTVAVVLGGGSLVFIGLAYVFRPGDFGLGPDGYPQ